MYKASSCIYYLLTQELACALPTHLHTVNPFYNHALITTFFVVTLTNCDLNMYSHISYKPLQDYDYRQKKHFLQNSFFMLE
jgi:hypothetical protein